MKLPIVKEYLITLALHNLSANPLRNKISKHGHANEPYMYHTIFNTAITPYSIQPSFPIRPKIHHSCEWITSLLHNDQGFLMSTGEEMVSLHLSVTFPQSDWGTGVSQNYNSFTLGETSGCFARNSLEEFIQFYKSLDEFIEHPYTLYINYHACSLQDTQFHTGYSISGWENLEFTGVLFACQTQPERFL